MSCRVLCISLMVCTVVCVSMEISSSELTAIPEETTERPMSIVQLKFLASLVCSDLFPISYDGETISTCEDNFTNSTDDVSDEPAELQYLCRTNTTVKFTTATSEVPKLVALIPDNEFGELGYLVMQPLDTSGMIEYITDAHNYIFWTASLHKDGSHSVWRRGPNLPAWDDRTKVTISEPKFEYIVTTKKFNAVFDIDIVGELNACSKFDYYNFCKNPDTRPRSDKILEPNIKTKVTIKNLTIDDECTLRINANGNWNASEKKYRTPVPKHTHLPEVVKNVGLQAIPTITGWQVVVSWDPPKNNPISYKITLQVLNATRSVTLNGDATKFIFDDVIGEEDSLYNVSIASFTQNGTALKYVLGRFPLRPSYQAVIITGSWTVVLTLAAAAIGVIVWWRRRRARKLKLHYITAPELKLPKDCMFEFFPEPGEEDGWELHAERLLMHEVIGEGAFGVVRRGTLAPAAKEVAVKMLKEFPTQEEVRSFRAEMELMKSVGAHAHIVSLVGCCSGRRPLIVAEYCSRGDLLSFLRRCWDVMVSKRNAKYYNNNLEVSDYRNDLFKKQKDSLSPLVVNKMYDLQDICDAELTPSDLLSFCRQIAMGMEFLASNRVVHRDLAARNVLVTGDRTLKIADFGLSRDVYQENQYKQKGNGKLPVKWMALESLTRRIYTTQSDVWSFGVVIWEVVTMGAPPYPEVAAARLPRLLRAGYRMPRPNNCSKQLYDLMMACWRETPRERPTFADLHRQLDELLNSACADEYLALELDHELPATPKPYRYITMILRRNCVWGRGENYERPLKASQPQSNHYTTPPHSTNVFPTPNTLKTAWHSVVEPTK